MNLDFTPAPCKTLYSAESGGWQVPPEQRPADWQSRESFQPVVETKPDFTAMQSLLDHPQAQRLPTMRTKPGPGRPRTRPIKSPSKRPKVDGRIYAITDTDAYTRRKAGESAKEIAASVGCTVHWIFSLLRQSGFKDPRICLDCSADIAKLAANATRCKLCNLKARQKRNRELWRAKHGKGVAYKVKSV